MAEPARSFGHATPAGPDPDFFHEVARLIERIAIDPRNTSLLNRLGQILASRFMLGEAYDIARHSYGIDGNAGAGAAVHIIENPPPPKEVVFEVSTVCNLKCPLCENGAGMMHVRPQFMPLKDFRHIWDRLRESTASLNLTGLGESFLHPDIYDILDHVGREHYLYIDTNGNADLDFDRIIDAGVDEIVFAADGIHQEMYERYRVGGRLDKVLDNIRGLAAAKARRGAERPAVVFKYILFRHTEMHIEAAERLAGSLGADHFRVEASNFRPGFGPRLFKEFLPRRPEFHRMEYVNFADNEVGCGPGRNSRHCAEVYGKLMVTVEGEVSPCCDILHEMSFGNLKRQDAASIWGSPAYRDFRLKVLQNRWDVPLCRVCSSLKPRLERLFPNSGVPGPPPGRPIGPDGVMYLRDNPAS